MLLLLTLAKALRVILVKLLGARGKPSTFVYRAGCLVEPFHIRFRMRPYGLSASGVTKPCKQNIPNKNQLKANQIESKLIFHLDTEAAAGLPKLDENILSIALPGVASSGKPLIA